MSHEGRRGVWVEPADKRIVRAAVIGTPNAGKSTLINQLLGHKVVAIVLVVVLLVCALS